MLNFHQIDNKFCLSGGWTNIEKDALWLKINNIKAVLELQFTPDFGPAYTQLFEYIKEELSKSNIEYFAVPMYDGPNSDIESIFDTTYEKLQEWEHQFNKRFEKILVKCGVGVSRSVATLIHYYCVRDRLTYDEALFRVQRADYSGELLPISIERFFDLYLRTKFPEYESAFGEKE